MADPKNRSKRRRSPVQGRSRHTVASILEAAARLYDRGATTTNGIARLAGVSIGSLYEYFPNKDAILDQLFEAHVEEAVATLTGSLERLPPTETPLEVGVRTMVEQLLGLHTTRPGLQRIFVQRLSAVPWVRTRIEDAEHRIRVSLQAWLALHPEVAVPDVELATRVMVEGTNGLVHAYVVDDEGVDEHAFVAELTRLWLRYLGG